MESVKQHDSYSFAEDMVVEQLKRETHEWKLKTGDEIEVGDLDQCDCVPVQIRWQIAFQDGWWRLCSCRLVGSEILATYRFQKKG